jgi:DtxR family Mn-dependent transcriptional regulator
VSSHHVDLIDTTEMYLRTIYELEEEGIVPLRARIAERLSQSGPTVSQTVARMERDGLVHVESDRQLQLSPAGRRRAIAVMRKHRIAERLLQDVIGLEWDQLHIEACRWEHVMSDEVERRILALLERPLVCPHGNPIPGLEELGIAVATVSEPVGLRSLAATGAGHENDTVSVVIERISEQLQPDAELMRQFAACGLLPQGRITVSQVSGGLRVTSSARDGSDAITVLRRSVAEGIFVSELV